MADVPSTPHGVFTSKLVHPKPGPPCGVCPRSLKGAKRAQNRIGGRANGKTPGKQAGKTCEKPRAYMKKPEKTRSPSKYIDNDTHITAPSDKAPLKTAPYEGKPGPLCGRCPLRGRPWVGGRGGLKETVPHPHRIPFFVADEAPMWCLYGYSTCEKAADWLPRALTNPLKRAIITLEVHDDG